MRAADAWLIGIASIGCLAVTVLTFKELKLLCFDEGFAGSAGYPVFLIDVLLMLLVILVTIIGLQSVGLVLIIALLVIPPAAARFWTWSTTSAYTISFWGSTSWKNQSPPFAMAWLACPWRATSTNAEVSFAASMLPDTA